MPNHLLNLIFRLSGGLEKKHGENRFLDGMKITHIAKVGALLVLRKENKSPDGYGFSIKKIDNSHEILVSAMDLDQQNKQGDFILQDISTLHDWSSISALSSWDHKNYDVYGVVVREKSC